jgi:hypothetical protein
LKRVQEWTERLDIDLCPTVGSSAWNFAQRRFNVPKAFVKGDDFTFARSAYYGGRCEVFKWGEQTSVYEYDVRSMYPWALASQSLPAGKPYRSRSQRHATADLAMNRPGIYDVTVRVPDTRIPPLPYRGKNRIYYPTGTFRGIWALPEILHALDTGCVVETVHSALVFSGEQKVFGEWASQVFRIRHEESGGADSSLGEFAKFLANSLTGKLGQNPERWEHVINPERLIVCSCADFCTCNPHVELSPSIYKRRIERMSDCMHPQWAAYLTSISRVKLHRMLTAREGDACYCDTDSVFAQSFDGHAREVPDKAELGDFEFKGKFDRCYFAAPKVYEKDGKVKAKGIGKAAASQGLKEGVSYSTEGIIGFGTGAKKGKFFRKATISRKLTFHTGGRVIVSASGDTRPMTIHEVTLNERKGDT